MTHRASDTRVGLPPEPNERRGGPCLHILCEWRRFHRGPKLRRDHTLCGRDAAHGVFLALPGMELRECGSCADVARLFVKRDTATGRFIGPPGPTDGLGRPHRSAH